MELPPGNNLKDRVKDRGTLPVTETVDAILQVIDGLEPAPKSSDLNSCSACAALDLL